MDSATRVFLSVFRKPFCGCLQTLNRNALLWIIMNFWCKNSGVVKNLSNSGSFFLLSFPKYFGTILFNSLYAQISCIFWKISFTKKSLNLERLHRKDKPSQNLLKLLVSVKTCLVFKFSTWQNLNWDYGVLGGPKTFSNRWKFKKASTVEKCRCCLFVKKKPNSRFMKPWK